MVRWPRQIASLFLFPALAASAADRPFTVRVIDEETGRGVPMVELRTLNDQIFFTDSGGVTTLSDPALMGRRVAFVIRSHGYRFPARLMIPEEPGSVIDVKPGGAVTLKIRRANIAERLYRITGAGIYRDSLLAGLRAPIRQPLMNGEVLGQDTAITALYRNRIFWCWGDTVYPASMNFSASCATSELPSSGGLEPDAGIDLTYFTDDAGRAKPMLPLDRKGLVWLEGLFTVRDLSGNERLVATYTRQDGLKPPTERGIAVFDDVSRQFRVLKQFPAHVGHVSSHPFRRSDGGRAYWYLYPNFRVPDEWEAIQRFEAYEAFTCLRAGAQFDKDHPAIERDARGAPLWGWKANTGRILNERALVESNQLSLSETRFPLSDLETGQPVYAGVGSVAWNEFLQKWVMIFSWFGTVYYAEADRPEGPWPWSRKIVTHDDYTFYNPVHHPFFDGENGRIIYFEGTYTDAFSRAKAKTPLYNYNQIMYRLRLDNPKLRPVR